MRNIGEKYYKTLDNGNIDIVRYIGENDERDFILDHNGDKKRVDKSYLNSYIKLNPDGILFFNIVKIGEQEDGNKDIIVALNRRVDLDKKIGLPYCACRQMIFDTFSNMINKTENKIFLGMSLSIDTAQDETNPYNAIIACSGVDYSENISVYLDDKLSDMLNLIKDINTFNKVFDDINKKLRGTNYIGVSQDLAGMLKENNFMYDFRRAFNIYEVNFKMKIIEEYELSPELKYNIEEIIKCKMMRTYVTPYSKEINLNKIERDYILICDNKQRIYIVAYDKGEYINRTFRDKVADKRDAILLLKHLKEKNKK